MTSIAIANVWAAPNDEPMPSWWPNEGEQLEMLTMMFPVMSGICAFLSAGI